MKSAMKQAPGTVNGHSATSTQLPTPAGVPPECRACECRAATPEQLAFCLHLTPDAVVTMANAHEIPGTKFGTEWRFDVATVKTATIASGDVVIITIYGKKP